MLDSQGRRAAGPIAVGIILSLALGSPMLARQAEENQESSLTPEEELEHLREESRRRDERFRLYTGCRPVYLGVQVTQDPSSRAGVAQVTIERAVRSRLRGAGMYQESLLDEQGRLSPILSVRVWLRGPAVHLRVLLMKQLIDYGADANMHATTWRIERLGAHGRNRGAVSQAIAEMVDEFLDEYLRVNEADY
jgi:hypothetical protein